MIAIQCLRLFDGEAFSPGPATVLVEENWIVAVEPGFPALGGCLTCFPQVPACTCGLGIVSSGDWLAQTRCSLASRHGRLPMPR